MGFFHAREEGVTKWHPESGASPLRLAAIAQTLLGAGKCQQIDQRNVVRTKGYQQASETGPLQHKNGRPEAEDVERRSERIPSRMHLLTSRSTASLSSRNAAYFRTCSIRSIYSFRLWHSSRSSRLASGAIFKTWTLSL